MISQLSQEQITEYASDAQTTQQPTGSDYSQGVRVGKTIPAKWWNWLFNAATKRIFQARNDSQNMLTELKNAVVDAGITPDATVNNQLALAVRNKTQAEIDTYAQNIKALAGVWNNMSFLVVHGKLVDDLYYCHVLQGSSEFYGCITRDFDTFEKVTTLQFRHDSGAHWPDEFSTSTGAVMINNTLYTGVVKQYSSVCEVEISKVSQGTPSVIYTKQLTRRGATGIIFVINKILYCLSFNRDDGGYTLAVKGLENDVFTEYTGTTTITGQWAELYYIVTNMAVTPIRLSSTKYLIGSYIIDISNKSITAIFTVSGKVKTSITYTYQLDETHYLVQPCDDNDTYFCAIVATDGTVSVKDYYTSVRLHKQLGGSIIIKQSSTNYADTSSGLQSFSVDGGATFKNFPTSWDVDDSGSMVTKTGEVRNCFVLNGKYYTSVYIAADTNYVLFVSDTISDDSTDYTQVTPRTFTRPVYAVGDGRGMVCPASSEYSEDLGLTWHIGYMYDSNVQFCCDIGTIAKGRMLANGASNAAYSYVSKYTTSRVNRVIGHTLYLR